MNKVFQIFALVTVLILGISDAYAGKAGSLKTGRTDDGVYVMPMALAEECSVTMSDSNMANKVKECIKRLFKDATKDSDSEKHINDVFTEARNESRIATLADLIYERVYSSLYEEDVIENFQKEMSGAGGVGKKIGGGESASQNEDWANIANADYNLALFASSHLNNVQATELLYEALEELGRMNASYLPQEAKE